MKPTNIGIVGPESLRLNNKEIGELPLGQNNEAKMGISEFLKTYKETKANNIKGKYPKHKREFLLSRIRECEANIKRIKGFKQDLKNDIATYNQLIKNDSIRNQEMAKYDADNPDHKEALKALRLQYPPYNLEALQQQIDQFQEGIDRCDSVIEQEYESISEIKEVLGLVTQRDRELANL